MDLHVLAAYYDSSPGESINLGPVNLEVWDPI